MGNMIPDYTRAFNSQHQGAPLPYFVPTHDHNEGFSQPRKELKMIATKEEMDAAKVPSQYRDFCAHLYIQYHKCAGETYHTLCGHERHQWNDCKYEEKKRMIMEYEREFRLRQREIRMERREAAETMVAG